MQIHADYSFEIEVSLSGTFVRGAPERGPSYSSGGEPAEPDMVEDIAIEDIGMLARTIREGQPTWTTRSLLAGVDRNSDAYRTICANILAMIGEDAELALVEGARE